MNIQNKKIWDDIFQKQPTIDNVSDCCTMCEDESGNYVPATPIGFDDEQKEYDALKEIIESALKNKDYKTWHIGSELVETYSDEHAPIEKFDVIYLFTKSWEEPKFPVLVKNITDNEIELWWLGGEDNEETKKQKVKFKN